MRNKDSEYRDEIFSYMTEESWQSSEIIGRFFDDLDHIEERIKELKERDDLLHIEKIRYKVVYNVDDIQALFSCGSRQARELMNNSSFPSFKIGNKSYVGKESFYSWLKEQENRDIVL